MFTAVYAFSGDPITYGHIDIVKRAARIFDQLIVAIGVNPEKKYMFTLAERLDMAQRSLAAVKNVRVASFKGLLVDFAYENSVDVIVKGVRSNQDFDYEQTLHQIGESQKLGIETVILCAKPELAHISSSAVKQLQQEQGLIHEYLPLYVKQCLEKKISQQFIVGVTGEVAAGKSFFCQQFIDYGKKLKIPVHHLELDQIGHQILSNLSAPKYQEIRQEVIKTFDEKILSRDGKIDRKLLGEIVFNDQNKLNHLNQIMYTPMLVRLRRELYGKKGLILFNAALLVESKLLSLCNNNVILVTVDKVVQRSRLAKRGLNEEQIKRRLASQYHSQQKKTLINQQIKLDQQGQLWIIDSQSSAKELPVVFDRILANVIKK